MKRVLIPLILMALGGCTSLQQAGTASYTVRPMLIDGRVVCCELSARNGKQYASLDAALVKRGDDYTVVLSERGVEAFRGQEIAAAAMKSSVSLAGKAVTAAALATALPAVLPVAGAALASPGIGAAAVGAGALAVGQVMAR